MNHDPSDTDWIERALARYEGPLLRYAVRMLGDAERARDAVQETFLELCRAQRSAVEDHLAAWLFRVCRHRALSTRRKEMRVEPLPEHIEKSLPSQDPSPEAMTGEREHATRVKAILETLSESQQEAVYLRFQSGLSYKEISQVTGHSVANVGSLLHEAVRKIRARLAADESATAIAGGAR